MKLLGKVYSEGYCCIWGYLTLCRARGESTKGMAENVELRQDVIQYHYRELKVGRITCDNRTDCMKNIIAEIEKAP